jgi:hypothetical protein
MVLVYLPTKLGHLWGKWWDSYSSTMEYMGMGRLTGKRLTIAFLDRTEP